MRKLILKILLVFCSLFLSCSIINAQNTPYAERLVTLKVTNIPLSEVLKNITAQTGAEFSYSRLNDKQKISLSWYKKPLRLVLDELSTSISCTYKIRGKYIILKYHDPEKSPLPLLSFLTGYIYNAKDSNAVENASIFIKRNKKSVTSDKYGHFRISYPKQYPEIGLSVAKKSFYDTTLIISNKEKKDLMIYLQPKIVKQVVMIPDTMYEEKADTFIPQRPLDTMNNNIFRIKFGSIWAYMQKKANFVNINDTFFSRFSFSLIPSISTNRLLSINTVNDFSFNLISGNSKGINILEIGGLHNFDNGNVRYCQVAGLSNIVNGNFKGFQISGLCNLNFRNTSGLQVAGLYNYTYSSNSLQIAGIGNRADYGANGGQIAGIINISDSVKGLQVAGIANIADPVRGLQLAGIANTAGSFRGMQLAGISDIAGSFRGLQMAGISNIADTVNGFQLAGIVNISKFTDGCQVSGILNKTKYLKGFQLSLINIADSCKGIPFGFFNYVRNGYHKIELTQDELSFTYLALSTGVEKLHNIFFAGKPLTRNEDMWAFGYGVGTSLCVAKKLFFVSNLSSRQIMSTKESVIKLNLLNRLFAGIEYRFVPKFSIAIGPSYNILVSNNQWYNKSIITDRLPVHYFFTTSSRRTDVLMWAGAELSVKVL